MLVVHFVKSLLKPKQLIRDKDINEEDIRTFIGGYL